MAKAAKRNVKKSKPKAKKRQKKKRKAVMALVEREMGRPVEYRPEFCELAAKLCHLGATDMEIADFLGVNKVTIYRWQATYPDFCNSIKLAKETANERVARSLYQKAVGYTYESEKLFYDSQTGKVIRAPVREHVPPSDTSIIFFLKNRRPDEYRDKHEVSTTNTNINLTRSPASVEEAQAMFRQVRSMTAAELEKHFKIVDGTLAAPALEAPETAPVDDADESEEAGS